MKSSRCMLCKCVPEPPYDGALVVRKVDCGNGEYLISHQILCTNCYKKVDRSD